MKLVVQSGAQPGQTISITKDVFSVGRSADNDLMIPDGAASRRHFQIRREAGALVLYDLNSANGTRVNQVRIAAPRPLQVGDVIAVGQTTLRVEEDAPPTVPGAVVTQAILPDVAPVRGGGSKTALGFALGGIVILCVLGLLALVLWNLSRGGTPSVSLPAPTQAAPSPLPAVTNTPLASPVVTKATTEGVRITSANAASVALITQSGRGPVNRIAWSPDQKQLALASSYAVYLYDANTLEQILVAIPTNAWNWSVAFSPNSERVVCGSDNKVLLFQTSDGKSVAGFTPEPHADLIYSVTFSPPDGKYIASAGEDKVIRLVNATTGRLEKKFEGHTQPVRQIMFSPNGALLASASDDATIRLWDVSSGMQVAELRGHTGPVLSVAFNRDGTQLVSGGSDSFARVWQVDSRTLVRELKGHIELVLSVAFSPDDKYIATGSGDRTVRVWNAANGSLERKLGDPPDLIRNWVWGLAFSADSTRLAAGSWDGIVRVWRVNDWGLAHQSKIDKDSLFTHDFQSIGFPPVGATVPMSTTTFATGSDDGAVRLWRIMDQNRRNEKGEPIERLEVLDFSSLYDSWVDSVAFSKEGNWLASGARDTYLRVWQVDNSKLEVRGDPKKGGNWYRSVAFSPTDKALLASGNWQALQLWRVGADGQPASAGGIFPPPDSWVRSIAFSQFLPDKNLPTPTPSATARCKIGVPGRGELMAYGGDDGKITLIQLQEGAWKFACDFKAHSAPVRTVAFSAERNLLASAGEDKMIRLWRISDGELLQELKGHNGSVNALAFNPDGTLLASGSWDKTIRLWRMRDGLMIKELKGHYHSVDSLAFSPDGTRLSSGSYDGTIIVWGILP
jgi:WD40 repeat protein